MGDLTSNGTVVASVIFFYIGKLLKDASLDEGERKVTLRVMSDLRIFYCINTQRTHDSVGACVFNERYLGRVYRAAATPSRPHDTPSQKFTSTGTRCRILPNTIVTVLCEICSLSYAAAQWECINPGSILREQSLEDACNVAKNIISWGSCS